MFHDCLTRRARAETFPPALNPFAISVASARLRLWRGPSADRRSPRRLRRRIMLEADFPTPRSYPFAPHTSVGGRRLSFRRVRIRSSRRHKCKFVSPCSFLAVPGFEPRLTESEVRSSTVELSPTGAPLKVGPRDRVLRLVRAPPPVNIDAGEARRLIGRTRRDGPHKHRSSKGAAMFTLMTVGASSYRACSRFFAKAFDAPPASLPCSARSRVETDIWRMTS